MTQQNGLDINNQEQNKEKLTHFNEAGEAHMVDVHAKDDTYRCLLYTSDAAEEL